ncbi:MAG: DUF5685 family protein [Firmicutes bacterium]|nr:DUF5685 family protein [Bacillota bacterium]
MYGYVLPDKQRAKKEEMVCFFAYYCGLCDALKSNFGFMTRFSINYDAAFFTILICDQLNFDCQIVLGRCAGSAFKKHPVVAVNELTKRIADLNVLLAFCKLSDNIEDGEFAAKSVARLLQKQAKQAKSREGQMAKIVAQKYADLRKIEQQNSASVDMAADCFACMLRDCAAVLLGDKATDDNLGIVYNVAKFIYLADALDDICADFKKGRYNPFLAGRQYAGRQKFIKDNFDFINFSLQCTINRAIECVNATAFNHSFGILENIVHFGLRKKADELLNSCKKLKRAKV